MIRFPEIEKTRLAVAPFGWAAIRDLFEPRDAASLATSYPRDNFKTIEGHDQEKGYRYEARCLISMGADRPSHPESLSPAWRQLASDLLSPDYREAMSGLTGMNLRQAGLEVNVFHYDPGCWLGPHVDLKDKIVTHVLYFNADWDVRDGGCLEILRSSRADDRFAEVPPLVGHSAVLVRSDNSWHAVSRVREGCLNSRRSMTVTFYAPGSTSTMWPTNERAVYRSEKSASTSVLLNMRRLLRARLSRA